MSRKEAISRPAPLQMNMKLGCMITSEQISTGTSRGSVKLRSSPACRSTCRGAGTLVSCHSAASVPYIVIL
ncbi:hypothetical protein IAQ61_011923 [Plenodomus lingam]|uniref:uncharacterized protein n=1 Tax=Leptosphaeria maculans TaxID=5022 RepID=UPI003330C1A4|nr:hypothetical protein IAQ61_011923 [Plenodomus lingam]